ncbi:hypothetical protein MATL_G00200010 [Megalops atlanticus]|uniref:Immunoglobulin V-set domain-containing protein n=1 Tax=Megalops atlanticus TaxID=7932 RepID=A0A9D3T167_MEGAT|nr:hypothetical protein MATL_G00200010 [Megalops atlanticus]
MPSAAIFLLFLLSACSAGTPLFQREGEDLTLTLQRQIPQNIDSVSWKFNKNKTILKYDKGENKLKIYGNYIDRANLTSFNFCLILRNLTQNDMGMYSAVITDSGGDDHSCAEYTISVQERVPAPVLVVQSNSSSPDSCNSTVTCRGQRSNLTAHCDSSTCTPVTEETQEPPPPLSLYLHRRTVFKPHTESRHPLPQDKQIPIPMVTTEYDVIRLDRCSPPLHPKPPDINSIYSSVEKRASRSQPAVLSVV